jgi:hypothetical protein
MAGFANGKRIARADNYDNGLFQLHSDGSIWYLGSSGWVLVDNNAGGKAIAASSFIQTK